jgi:L-seryl-tRNA(Ser) seleniumtransferase
MSIYERFGVQTVINACGTVTRLSGGMTDPVVLAAMQDAAAECVDMIDLQAGASRVIARVTGAEAGIVTSGASAALLLGAAACLTGLDPARMNRLPDIGSRRDFLMVRSQRNMYDRVLTLAGGRIVEIGIPDRYSGPGVRDAASWELDAAVTADTAGILWLAQPQSLPALPEVAAVARAHDLPLLVDAAGQLPPAGNLRRFLEQGADLVAFSGGKAIGGPQATGILCGRRDLVSAALLQMLDLDLLPAQFHPPAEFAPLRMLPGLPLHGIGRSCKVGKEAIVGLMVALDLFADADDGARQAAWLATLGTIITAAGHPPALRILDRAMPLLAVATGDPGALAAQLAAGDPPILCGLARADDGLLLISPAALNPTQAPLVGARLRDALGAAIGARNASVSADFAR